MADRYHNDGGGGEHDRFWGRYIRIDLSGSRFSPFALWVLALPGWQVSILPQLYLEFAVGGGQLTIHRSIALQVGWASSPILASPACQSPGFPIGPH